MGTSENAKIIRRIIVSMFKRIGSAIIHGFNLMFIRVPI